MIYTRSTYWRSLALTPEERARAFETGRLQMRPPEPLTCSPRQDAIERVTAAVAEFRAIKNPRLGDLARIAREHGLKSQSIVGRMKKEVAAERERQRREGKKVELLAVCEMPGAGPKNLKNFEPNGRRG